MASPKISVIVPVYNIELYIEKCIESLVSQLYQNIEIILVDDGTKDNSGKICDEYGKKDSRIKIIHKQNGGLSSARNAGLDIAAGDYILFVDGDDWIEEDYVEKCVSKLNEAGEKVDLLITPYIREYKDRSIKNKLFKDSIYFEKSLLKEKVFRRFFGLYREELKNASSIDDLSTAWGKFYKYEYCQDVRFTDTKLIGTEDAWFNINVINKMDCAIYYDEVYYHYNKENQTSLVRSYNKYLFNGWKNLYAYMYDFIEKERLGGEYYEALNNRIIVNIFSLVRNIFNSNLKVKEKKQLTLEVLNDEIYVKAFEDFEYSCLDFKWKIFYKCCQKKQLFCIYVLVFLAEILKKKLK